MADPQVNPAGGSSSSWGPENIVTDPQADKPTQLMQGLSQGGVPVVDGDGAPGFVHHSLLPQFLSDNPDYKRAMVFMDETGHPGFVPADQAGEFAKTHPTYKPGLPQSAGWNPAETSRFASAKNFYNSIVNDPAFQKPTGVGGWLKALSPIGAYQRAAAGLKIPQDAASEVAQYLRAEGESPRAPSIVRNVTSPVGEAAAQFEGSQFEPQNLALLGGFSALPQNTAALRTLHRAIGGYFGTKMALGAAQQGNQAAEAYQRGDIPEAVRQATGAGLGAGMAVGAGTDTVNDIAANPQGAVSDLTATAVNPVLRAARAGRTLVDPLANMTPTDLLQRAVKPRNTIPNVEAKIATALPHARAAADQLGIDFNDENTGHDEALAAIRKAKQNVWGTLEQNHLAPASTFTQDTTPIADKIQSVADGMSDIAKRRNPALVDRITSAAGDYRGQQMSVADMEQRIQELNNELYAEQGKLKVQQDTLRRDPAYGQQFAELEGLRGALNDTLDKITGPGASDLKQTYGSLKALEDMVERSRNVAERKSPVGLFGGLGKIAGVGNVIGGGLRTMGGDVSGVPQLAKGAAEWYMGKKAQEMNDRNNLLREAFKRTTPAGAPPGPQAVTPPPTAAAPPSVPPVGPFARGAQPPPVAGEGTFRPATGTPEQAPLFTTPQAQTPTPAGNVAPTAPESPQGALQPPTVTPEQAARQNTAIEQAKAAGRAGVKDGQTHEAFRQAAAVPEIEPEHLRGVAHTSDAYKQGGQYTAEAQARHTKQVGQILGPEKAPEENPTVVFMGGGAATGKSTALGPLLKEKFPGVAVNDSDVIKFGDKKRGIDALPDAEVLKKSDPLGAAARLHEESSDVSKQVEDEALRRRQSLIIDKVNGNAKNIADKIRDFREAGYRVEVHYVDRDINDSLNSMVGRFEKGQAQGAGRWVPPDVLDEGHRKAARAFHQVAPLADAYSLRVANPKGGYDVVSDSNGVYNGVSVEEHQRKGGYTDDERLRLRLDRGGSQAGAPDHRGVSPQESEPPVNNQGPAVGAGSSGRAEKGTTAERVATVPAQEQGKVALHLADNAPPKNKPVILVQGGGYNPAHDGHVAAMQSAHDLLTGAGYTVDGHVVAPTADKLLAKKLGSDDRLSVEDRANIAKAAYPPEINGKPVEVQTGPAAEVEAMDRKPKRSDLAKNIQRQYPNHTVINVSGEDAGVPGAPANQPAALYQGDPGTSHEGINYITVPRVGGHSSTQIRNAYAAGEATLPGMNPEAERLYREAMGKKEAPEPVSTARQDVQVAQGQRIAGHDGNETTVRTPTGDKYPGKYRVVEGDTLTPSHDPMTFAKNPNYPEGVQERAYHSSKEAQNRVIQQAQNYDPGYTVNTDPTGSNGPAIITPDGTVLGGNSRVMSTDRLYRSGQGDVYKNELIKQAGQFGLDPEQIRGMKNPHLVREIEAPSSQEELRRIGKDLNRSMTGAPSVSERAVSAGKSLKPASLEEIGHMVDQTGEGASLREAMQKHGPDMLKVLQRDGVITDRERPALTDSSTGGLNEDGKNFVEKTLIGSIVEDPDLMSRTPKNVVNKLGSSVGDVASLAGRGDEYNITSLIRAALREHVAAAERGGPLEDHLRQQPMFGPARNPAVDTMARALDGPVKNLRASLRSFAQDARADVPGQRTMLLTGKQSATDAFNHAFGSSLSEDEFREALKSALLEERHTGKL